MNKDELKKRLAEMETVAPEPDEVEYLNKPIDPDLIPWEKTEKRINAKIEKFILRLPGSLGAELRAQAEAEGVSLNQYILTATAFYQGYKKGISDSK